MNSLKDVSAIGIGNKKRVDSDFDIIKTWKFRTNIVFLSINSLKYMKKILFVFSFLIVSNSVYTQNYGNEWIKQDQKYFKFTIAKTGVYRLEYFNLVQAAQQMDLDLPDINPKKFQIFNQGKEIPIYVAGEQDNLFNVSDFIEFYGTTNRGKVDEFLYLNGAQSANPEFNLLTDSNVYYLTFLPSTSSLNGLRFKSFGDRNYFSHPEIDYCYFNDEKIYSDRYNGGKDYSISGHITSNPEYVNSEGFASALFGPGTNIPLIQHTFETNFAKQNGPNASVEFRFFGVNDFLYNNKDHAFNVSVLSNNNIEHSLLDSSFDGYDLVNRKLGLNSTFLGSSNTVFRITPKDIPGIAYQGYGLSFVKLLYPRLLNLDLNSSFNFNRNASNVAQTYQWTNYQNGKNKPIFYDLENGFRIRGEIFNTNQIRVVLPAISKNASYYLTDSTNIINILSTQITAGISNTSKIDPYITFNPYSLINKHKFIMITHQKFVGKYTEDFLEYKNTLTYTGNPTLVTVQQLYNHFSYGVPHPAAIRNFIKFLKENGDTTFKFCFLVGRGYQTDMARNMNSNINLVPSIGVPSSDNLFATDIMGSGLGPCVAIGRLTIDQPVQLGIYLNKLRQYDESKDDFWRKHLMHLAGGENSQEAINFTNRLNFSANTAKTLPFGARVTTYTKSSVGISEPFMKQKLLDVISKPDDNGVQFVTFLGHGSSAVSDVDVGDTAEYYNKGKYPIFYFNGCNIGNPCTGPPSKGIKLSGERFINANEKGAMAFIGQTALSELGHVDRQIREMYRLIYHENYSGEFTIGEAIAKMLKNTGIPSSYLNVIQTRILFLQGDPSLRLFQPQKTDYEIDNKTVFLSPEDYNALSDSIAIAIPISNKGLYTSDSFNINITRIYPNTFLQKNYQIRVKSIPYKDTVFYYIKSKDAATTGINRFIIHINSDSSIDESNFENNLAVIDKFISGNSVNLIFPKKYDIVSRLNGDTVELLVQSLNIFDRNNKFEYEIDTSHLFNSPWLKKHSANTIIGSTNSWKLKLQNHKDSIVYYWRARIQEGNRDGIWSERSFVYIFNNEPGWSQSHHPQFYPSSEVYRINFNEQSRTFEFDKTAEKVYINTAYFKFPNFGIKKGGFDSRSLNPSTTHALVVALFDKNSLEQFRIKSKVFVPDKYYGLYYYEAALDIYNIGVNDAFVELVDSIPDGTYVAICNSNGIYRSGWTEPIKEAFRKLGSKLVDSFQSDNSSFAMIGRKGEAPGWAAEDTGHYFRNPTLDLSYIEVEKELNGKRNIGSLQSELIGPTTKWGGLHFWTSSQDQIDGDEFRIDVHGVSSFGKDSILFKNVKSSPLDLSSVDAKRFPNVYLKGHFEDLKNYTAPQLMHWRITNYEVPEGSLNTTITNINWRDTLQQGEDFSFELAFQNISKLSFDKNLKYDVSIYNIDTKDTVYSKTQLHPDSLLPNQYFRMGATINTKKLKGRYAFFVKVNINETNRSIMPELTLSNNSALRYFYVEQDLINPLLDVTFDGRHITNGEIVSASPVITITSKDENKINWQTDTSGIIIWLKKPGINSDYERIDFDSMGVKFYPATSSYNLAKVEFNPKNLADGIYSIKVQSRDANEILAGSTEYVINFQVISKQSVTNLYPYPNPFTTAMRFVFTLTGSEVPDEINIKIMNIQGKVIKELNKSDLGEIKIGNNITEVVWDGTDEFGDRLSNGVYLYTVTIKSKGETLTQLEDDNSSQLLNADKANNKYFKNATGKIVLLR